MNQYIIMFKPRSLDDRVELELVNENSAEAAMFKWFRENPNKHYSGYCHAAMTEEQLNLFNTDYEQFRKENYKSHTAFDYN